MKAGDAFRKYDYGPEKNSQMYQGSLTPPNFNLSSITTPIYIYYGDGDKLIGNRKHSHLDNAPNYLVVVGYIIQKRCHKFREISPLE